MNAARFSISGRLFVTGGADRRVKVWEQANGMSQYIVQFLFINILYFIVGDMVT